MLFTEANLASMLDCTVLTPSHKIKTIIGVLIVKSFSNTDLPVKQLITDCGNTEFATSLLAAMRSASRCDHYTLVTYDLRDYQAKTLISAGDLQKNLAKDCANLYDKYLYQQDPNFHSITSIAQRSEPLLQVCLRSDVNNREYRQRLFDRCNVYQKATFVQRSDNAVVCLNLYRLAFSPFTGPLALDWDSVSTTILASVLEKHVSLTSAKPGESLSEQWLARQLFLKFDGFLTPREQAVCLHIALGYTSDAIALNLNISANTVLTHRRNAYDKLRISTQSQLIGLLVDGMLMSVN